MLGDILFIFQRENLSLLYWSSYFKTVEKVIHDNLHGYFFFFPYTEKSMHRIFSGQYRKQQVTEEQYVYQSRIISDWKCTSLSTKREQKKHSKLNGFNTQRKSAQSTLRQIFFCCCLISTDGSNRTFTQHV